MKLISLILITILALFFSACGTVTEPRVGDSETSSGLLSTLQQEYLSAINDVRTKNQSCGSSGNFLAAPALTWSKKLYDAAYEHSNDMATTNTFSHDGSGQPSDLTGTRLGAESVLYQRVESYGYIWSRIGENIGAGTNTNSAQKIVAQLMASDGHCANIMNPNFKEVGMALVKKINTDFIHYWTQDFGTQR